MATIQSQVKEWKNINIELKRLSARSKMLRNRKKELETSIGFYFEQHNMPGVKFQGEAITMEKKTKKSLKPVKQTENDIRDFFVKHGIQNPHEAFEEFKRLKINGEEEITKLKLNKIKTK